MAVLSLRNVVRNGPQQLQGILVLVQYSKQKTNQRNSQIQAIINVQEIRATVDFQDPGDSQLSNSGKLITRHTSIVKDLP